MEKQKIVYMCRYSCIIMKIYYSKCNEALQRNMWSVLVRQSVGSKIEPCETPDKIKQTHCDI